MATYNPNPAPQTGFGAYGAVPGSIGLPSPAANLAQQYPNLGAANQQLSQNVLNESRGMLNPETVNNIQDIAAQWGVGSGMPGFGGGGSGLGLNLGLRSLGLTSQGLQQQGLGDYLNLTGGISKTQTLDPSLQAAIAARNAQFQAAPNPQETASTLMQDYQTGLNQFTPRGKIPAHITTPPNLTAPGFGGSPLAGPLAGYNTSVVGPLGTSSSFNPIAPLPPFSAGSQPYESLVTPTSNLPWNNNPSTQFDWTGSPTSYSYLGTGQDFGPNDPNSPFYDESTPVGTNPADFPDLNALQ